MTFTFTFRQLSTCPFFQVSYESLKRTFYRAMLCIVSLDVILSNASPVICFSSVQYLFQKLYLLLGRPLLFSQDNWCFCQISRALTAFVLCSLSLYLSLGVSPFIHGQSRLRRASRHRRARVQRDVGGVALFEAKARLGFGLALTLFSIDMQ